MFSGFLREELEQALRSFRVAIKLIRARERVGLIRARLMGAAEATGQVSAAAATAACSRNAYHLHFADAHILRQPLRVYARLSRATACAHKREQVRSRARALVALSK